MRFGLGPYGLQGGPRHEQPALYASALAQAEQAEALGFDSVWLAESHFTPEGALPSPLAAGAALAARTRRLRIGVCVTSTLVHPLRIAEDAAVLDVLSGGRLIFCAATGYSQAMFAGFQTSADGKGSRLREALTIMRRAWTGEPFRHEGNHWRIPAEGDRPVQVTPRAVQQPIPIWMASFGLVGVKRAAQLGLPFFAASLDSFPRLQEKFAHYWQHRPDGPAPDEVIPLIRDVYVAPTTAQAEADVVGVLGPRYRRYVELGLLPPDESPADLARDRLILGDPEAVVAEIRRYQRAIGLNYLVCRLALSGLDPARAAASLARFVRHVMPALAAV